MCCRSIKERPRWRENCGPGWRHPESRWEPANVAEFSRVTGLMWEDLVEVIEFFGSARVYRHPAANFSLTWSMASVTLLPKMKSFTTRQAAKRLGVAAATLSRYVKARKVLPPRVVSIGKFRVHSWTLADIRRMRAALPAIKDGRKSKRKKLVRT